MFKTHGFYPEITRETAFYFNKRTKKRLLVYRFVTFITRLIIVNACFFRPFFYSFEAFGHFHLTNTEAMDLGFKAKAAAALAAAVMCISAGAVGASFVSADITASAEQSAQEVRSIADVQNEWIGNIFYTGEAIEPDIILHDYSRGYVLVKDIDYSVTFADNVNAGKAKAVITGLGLYQGEKTIEFDIGKRPFYTDTQVTLTTLHTL